MRIRLRRKIRHIREWLLVKLVPDADARMVLLMKRVGYDVPKEVHYQTVSTQVVLNSKSYEFMHSADGVAKYDAVYGLTRQLADELKNYVKYTEKYDEACDEWTCRVDLKVVTE